MISNQILQSTIEGLGLITKHDISIAERDGKVCSSTEEEMMSRTIEGIPPFIASQAENQLVLGYQYFKVNDNGITEYVVIIKGDDEEAYRIGKITAFQLQTLIVAYKERFDKDNFIKNLLLDNLLLIDIYGRAKKLRVENNVSRTVYLIEIENGEDMNYIEMVRALFPSKSKDFVAGVEEKSIVVVKEIRNGEGEAEIMDTARNIVATLSEEHSVKARVSIGSVIADLKNISNSYKEAKMALEVGKIFDEEKDILSYSHLGIGRLIYQLPMTLCKIFMDEILKDIKVEQLEEETLNTINKFFENHLNVSETSRQLYIHRNTLVYRLDKLQKLTGLDLRTFEAAVVFKITMMVNKYMNYCEKYIF